MIICVLDINPPALNFAHLNQLLSSHNNRLDSANMAYPEACTRFNPSQPIHPNLTQSQPMDMCFRLHVIWSPGFGLSMSANLNLSALILSQTYPILSQTNGTGTWSISYQPILPNPNPWGCNSGMDLVNLILSQPMGVCFRQPRLASLQCGSGAARVRSRVHPTPPPVLCTL